MTTIGILHPGEMGASVGAAAASRGARVVWAAEGRSAETRARADADGLEALDSLADVVRAADIVISLCPPHGADELAEAVAAAGFTGVFCDANAISPAKARRIGERVSAAGARFVDGGVIGPPARTAGKTRLYLSGPDAERVAALFAGSLLDAIALEGGPGAASALKMCFAAWTKGRTALMLAVRALARAEAIEPALLKEWDISQPGLAADSEAAAGRVARKAWRWVDEMKQIQASFEANDLPGGFHAAASELYAAMAEFKTIAEPHEFDAVMDALLAPPQPPRRRAER